MTIFPDCDNAENNRLLKLEADMLERSQRIAELEALIASKDQAMRDLKDAISNALTAFEGKGLTVEQRDGKVYVSDLPAGTYFIRLIIDGKVQQERFIKQ